MNLSIDVSEKNDVHEVKLSGEIDVYTAPKLKETILPLTKQKGATVKIDLEKVQYMDSTGLGVFISGLKAAKEYESKLILVNLKDRVFRLFDITGLKEVFTIEDTIRGGK
ncbi:STAS domain-containing protein [Salinibacillus xinjiangensis]|uniref:Anti-sigma factor antagonist n=1 Tax=Salinibacillus xinjiangensis TaxID=1229268 RepID=A0A6G1X883_9BACI|nr:STAS domain-containing protein [Salinibacillus xinjiangensis]MRG87213.1 anti-sigma factor antagonist [Salinibacillus xinjiangensis]